MEMSTKHEEKQKETPVVRKNLVGRFFDRLDHAFTSLQIDSRLELAALSQVTAEVNLGTSS